MTTARGLTNAADLMEASDTPACDQLGYAWFRDGRLWTAALCTLLVKAVVVALLSTTWQDKPWLHPISADLLRWRDYFHDLQLNRVPFVDVPSPFLPLAAGLYWLMAHSMDLHSDASIQLVHASCMGVVDAVNAALLYSLARGVNSRYALPATLLVSLSTAYTVFSPLHIDAFVVSSLLIGYWLHQRDRPLAASAVWSLGCAIKWFPLALFLIQEIRAFRHQRRRKQWLMSGAMFVGVQFAICVPLLLAAWLRHSNVDSWIDSYAIPGSRSLSPVSLLGMAQLVAGRVRIEQYAMYWSLALAAAAIVLKPNQPLAFKVVLVSIAILILNRVYPRELHLWLYPFLMLVILQVESRRGLYLLAAFVLFDLISTQAYPFGFADAVAEMQQLRPRQAFRAGRGWTAYWVLCIVLRSAVLFAIARELWRGVEDDSASALRLARMQARWRAWLSTQNILTGLTALAIIVQCFWARAAIIGLGRYSDEGYHLSQIGAFCDGRYEIMPGLTMLPGYHAVSALLGTFARDCGPHAMRSFNVGWGLGVATLAFLILRSVRSERPLSRTIAFHFLPILYPYYFVVYTDVLGLVLVLLTTLFIVQQRFNAASCAAIAAVLVRQPNAVMLLLIAAIAWLEIEPRHDDLWQRLRVYLARTWVCWFGVFGFCLFVLVNKGIAVGDHGAHQPGFHTANIYFTLFLLSIVALPVIVETVWKHRASLASPFFVAALLAAYLLYMQTFEVTHPYNGHMNFMRNALLNWAVQNNLSKSLFFLPMALALGCVWTLPLQRRAFWVLVPLVCAMLVPEALIEQRYAILPIALWTLLRRDVSQLAEALNAAANAALATTVLMWIASGSSI